MDFKQMYQEKLVSAEKAASVIKSGEKGIERNGKT